jgi:hypothetical protein
MPIRPQHRWLYPIDWELISRAIRFTRAKGRCEQCARPHGQTVHHLGDGCWWDAEYESWRDGRGKKMGGLPSPAQLNEDLKCTRVYLATAHLDHNPGNNDFRNLKALCQRCHILNDAAEHRYRRWITYRRRKALGDLFEGRYM